MYLVGKFKALSIKIIEAGCMTKISNSMRKSIRVLIISFSLSLSGTANAQTGNAPCHSFQKLPDGKWNALKQVKIENGQKSTMIYPGTKIGPGTQLVDVDIYAALERSCH
jgi:hypothetical protein